MMYRFLQTNYKSNLMILFLYMYFTQDTQQSFCGIFAKGPPITFHRNIKGLEGGARVACSMAPVATYFQILAQRFFLVAGATLHCQTSLVQPLFRCPP